MEVRMRRLSFHVAAAAVLITAIACADQRSLSGLDIDGRVSTLAISPADPGATGFISGTVLGDRQVAGADTAGAGENFEHVAGATVAVYREIRDSVAGADRATNVSDSFVGTVTTEANGHFTLTNVDRDYFRLKVTPPAGSPYHPGSAGTESFADSTVTALVWLYSK